MPSTDKTMRLIRTYLAEYHAIGKCREVPLLEAAEVYDAWFCDGFRVRLESLLTIKAGRWDAAASSNSATAAAVVVRRMAMAGLLSDRKTA